MNVHTQETEAGRLLGAQELGASLSSIGKPDLLKTEQNKVKQNRSEHADVPQGIPKGEGTMNILYHSKTNSNLLCFIIHIVINIQILYV
jgi:hypothetical protein